MARYHTRKEEMEEEAAVMENGQELSEERKFMSKDVPPWLGGQLTLRSLVVSAVLSFLFAFIVMKLTLTTGIIPSLNVAAGLLGYAFIKAWTKVLPIFRFQTKPFTRQENTVIQTCVVASSGIAFSSGFATYIIGMTDKVAAQGEAEYNTSINTKTLSLSWMIGFTFLVSFVGLFSVLPLRKIMILDYKLTYPSGTATAKLINSFHTPQGNKMAKEQVKSLGKYFGVSFVWGFFQWFFTSGDACGFANFPTFGPQAFNRKLFFDFSSTYIGVGMLCPYDINLSMLLGAIVSWLIMWPEIEKKKGHWFSADLPLTNLRSLQGYKIFISIAMILGEGLFHFLIVLAVTFYNLTKTYLEKKKQKNSTGQQSSSSSAEDSNTNDAKSYDDQRRAHFFLRDQIPFKFALLGYVGLAAVSIVVVPWFIFHQLKWYHLLTIYIVAPVLAFCNSYGCGLTDWSLPSSYGKIAILVIGAWVGNSGGIVAGLAACGVMMSIVSTASDLMQDFKTGYLTLSSPRSMFVSQVFGTAIGCVISPLVFWFFFYKAYPDLGMPNSAYPAPFGLIFRSIALIGIQGTSALPKHCLTLSIGFFFGAIALNIIRDVLKYYKCRAYVYVPSAMAMAIPFFLGGYFVIDMCVGSLLKFIYERMDKEKAEAFTPAVASGLICGDSLWGVPAAVLSLFSVQPPLCMKFLTRADNAKVDAFLSHST